MGCIGCYLKQVGVPGLARVCPHFYNYNLRGLELQQHKLLPFRLLPNHGWTTEDTPLQVGRRLLYFKAENS